MSGFAIRTTAGLITHWQDTTLDTYEQAEACLAEMRKHGFDGEIERLILSVPVRAAEPASPTGDTT